MYTMEFNALNVAQGDCFGIGQPWTTEEAYAVFNLGIHANTVRKLSKVGYSTIEDYTKFTQGYEKEGCENREEVDLDASDETLPQSDEMESPKTDDLSEDSTEKSNSDEAADTDPRQQESDEPSTDETLPQETAEAKEDAEKTTASIVDPVKEFLKEKKVKGYGLLSPKVALAKAIELGYKA